MTRTATSARAEVRCQLTQARDHSFLAEDRCASFLHHLRPELRIAEKGIDHEHGSLSCPPGFPSELLPLQPTTVSSFSGTYRRQLAHRTTAMLEVESLPQRIRHLHWP